MTGSIFEGTPQTATSYATSSTEPPKWLQEPEWPLADDVPMVFVGQVDIRGLGHDTGQAYLFFDAQQQRFHTVSQRC